MLVFVFNKDNRQLMPCTPRKARILLSQGKARVIRKKPFTIQLLYGSTGYIQPERLQYYSQLYALSVMRGEA